MIAPRHELARWADRLEGSDPRTILEAAATRFPGRVGFATGFGPEGCVLVDVAARAGIALDVFTLDTGYLFPETCDLWRRLEARYGIRIRGVRPAAPPAADGAAPPWLVDPDGCCDARKVVPLRTELARFDAWVTAIRRDQTPDRAKARVVEWDGKFGLVKINPLAAWTARDVWRHLKEFDVPTNPLHDRGYTSIGCAPCTTPVVVGEDPRAGRWRGRAKTECGLHSQASTAPAGGAVGRRGGDAPSAASRPSGSRPGYVLWLTGLSGAGKSTLSAALRPALAAERPVEILDGDEVRTYLSAGLGFSKEDRDTNVRRIGYVARLLARNGAAVVTAAISPYASTRDEVRALVEREGVEFVEVHVSASLGALAARDPKGLYRRALAGEIPHFTGVSDPYEAPSRPDVVVRTDVETVEESSGRILDHLRARGLLGAREEAAA